MNFDPSTARPDDGPAAPPKPQASAGLFDPRTAIADDAPPVREVVRQAVKVKPEAAAEADRLSRRYPAPYEVVKRNADDFQMFEIADQVSDALSQAPHLTAAFRNNPRLAELAHDDVPTLSKIERAVGGAVRYMLGAGPTKPMDDLRAADKAVQEGITTLGLGATVGVGKMAFDIFGMGADLLGLDGMAANARYNAKRAGEAMDAEGLQPTTSTGKAVKSGLQSAGTNLAMLPAGLARGLYATASQAATTVAGLMGAGVGADAYNEARDKGKGKAASLAYGIPQGVFEFVFEKIPAQKLFGDLANNTALVQTLKHQAFSEAWTEQMTTLAQDFNTWMNLNPEKTVAEFILERPEAAYQTLVATLVGVGVQTTTIHGINKAVEKATDQRLQFQQDAFEDLQKIAATSALRERSPEQFRTLMAQMVEASDTPQKSIHVDAQVLSQLSEDVLAQLPESVRAQIPAEAAKNGTVEISIADVLTVAPGTPLEQLLNDNARMTPEALSRADALAAGDKAQVLRQEAERVIQQAQDQQVARADYDQVQQMYAQQVAASGRYRPAVADAMGHWLASFYTAYGSRSGMTATEMQARYPVRVLGAAPADSQGGVMDQPGTPNFDAWFGDSKVRNTEGKPLVVYHGTGADVEMFNTSGGPGKTSGTGAFFSSTPEVAATYATGGPANVVPVYLNLRTPLVIDAGGANWSSIAQDAKVEMPEITVATAADQEMEDLAAALEDRAPETAQPTKRKARSTNVRELFEGEWDYPDDTTSTDDIARWARKQGYDGLVIRNVKDHGPSGRFATDDKLGDIYVAFDPKQIKSATGNNGNYDPANPSILEQAVNETVAELLVQHNLSAENLLHAKRMGGIPVPSLAVTKKSAPMENFGEITLLGTKEMADPKGYAGTKVFGAGIYSPRYPSVEFKLDSAAQRKLNTTLAPFRKEGDREIYGSAVSRPDDITHYPPFKRWAADRYGVGENATTWSQLKDSANALMREIDAGERIFQGFTNSGNRRYTPHTLDNVVKILKKELRGGENFNYGVGSLRAKFTPQFKSVAQVQKAKDRLVDKAAFEAIKKEIDAEFTALATDLGLSLDRAIEVVEDSAKMGAKRAINRAFKDYKRAEYEATDEQALAVGDFARKLVTLPTQYFEAQILRAVDVAEFAAAVVPVDASQEVLDALAERGVTRVAKYDPNVEGDRTAKIGQFNDLFFQKQREAQTPRGTFNPATLELVLNPNANLSTFFHETGHFFLEVMADIASQPNAPAQIVEDMATFLKWAGFKDLATWNALGLDGKRAAHERWAESIEQYVMEGKAPSVELQPLMRRFATWLKSVYGSVKAFLASKPETETTALNDDIRRVMDRMLATDAQIAQANEVSGLLPDLEADALAAERLNKRSMADLKWSVRALDAVILKLRKQAKAIEKTIRAEVIAEVNVRREVQAKDMLAKSQKDNGGKLNDTERAIIADAFGYETVDEMLQSIDAFGSKTDAIDGLTQQRMLQEHGDLTDDDAIRQAALEAVHNEARARSLATELRTQSEMLNPRADTGEVNAKGSKITVNALIEAAKQFATNVVARTPLRDLKAKAWQHTAAERRAGQRWTAATADGKTQEAVQAKQDQMLNHAAAKAALDARTEMGRILEFFKRVVKGNDEKVVEKGRDADVVNAARAVLGVYGIETPASKGAEAYLETLQRNDPALHAVIAPMVDGATRNAQPIEALTFEELQALHEEIAAMWHLAKSSREYEVNGNKMDIEDAAAEVRARMEIIGIPDEIPGETGALTKKDERVRWLQFAGALLRRVEQWSEAMDGKFGGPFLRYIFQPVKEAANRYRTDKVAYRKKFQALVDAVAPTMTHQLIAAPELGYTFGRGHNGIGHAELLHALLHTGNESNKRKLLLGRNWAVEGPDGQLDTSKWDAFTARLVNEGVLQPAHYDFAQGVWDLLEETKPLAQKAHRDVFGRYFAEVTADAFTDPWGLARRGGYVPAQADPNIVTDADIRALAEAENESMAYSFPTTNKGFTKSRVEYNRPLKLDLRTIPQHLDKVLLFSHMEPAVRGVSKLLRSKTVSQALTRIDPSAYSGMLLPWLNRSAKQIVETPILGDGRTSRVLSTLRSRAGAALMFANISNTLQQTTGFVSAFGKMKADGLDSHMMRSTAQMIAHPKEMKAAVADKSEYMATRMDGEIAAMTDAMNDILLNPSLYEKSQAWATRNSYFLQSAMDNTMGPIIWTAAYNAALERGQTDTDAVRYADGVIRQTQGANSAEDISRIESGPAPARIFTQFISYFNMMANTNATALKQIAGEMGLKKGAGKALGVVFFGMLAPIWIAEAIAQAFRGGPEDEDKDGYLDDWLAAVFGMGTIKGLLAQVPFVAQVGQVVLNRFNTNPADDRFSLSPAISLLESAASVPYDIYKQIVDGARMQKLVRDSAALVSLATGLPATWLARPLGYAAGVADGKIDPTSAADAVRGAVTGVASPDSKVK